MSGQSFTFPPPPPPPPPARTNQDYNSSSHDGGFRGRGGFRGDRQTRGSGFRGRGQSSNYNTGRGGFGYSNQIHHVDRGPSTYTNSSGHENSQQSGSADHRSQISPNFTKRSYSTAFQKPNTYIPRPKAPPAVPSFNAGIEALINPTKPSPPLKLPKQQQNKRSNQLGLTPAKDHTGSASDNENDVDEESQLAKSTAASDGLQFEYNGQKSSLRTAADIAAWIAERRRKYPTQAKIEKARKEAEEKKRKWEEQRNAALQVQRDAKERSEREKKAKQEAMLWSMSADEIIDGNDNANMPSKSVVAESSVQRAQARAEKLRRRAAKAEQDLAKAEERLRKAREPKESTAVRNEISQIQERQETEQEDLMAQVEAAANGLGHHSGTIDTIGSLSQAASPEDPDPFSTISDSDETSSSGSDLSSFDDDDGDNATDSVNTDSDSNSDAAPEQLTSKRTAPDRVLPPPRTITKLPPPLHSQNTDSNQKPPCRSFLKFKSCKFGNRCRYSHDLVSSNGATPAPGDSLPSKSLRNETRKHGIAKESKLSSRKGLFQVLIEKQQEEERRAMVKAIIELGQKGVLDD